LPAVAAAQVRQARQPLPQCESALRRVRTLHG